MITLLCLVNVQDLAKRWSPSLVSFAVAHHFCLALPAAFTQPGDHLLAEPCTNMSSLKFLLLVLVVGAAIDVLQRDLPDPLHLVAPPPRLHPLETSLKERIRFF